MTLGMSYFDALYERASDPWEFRTRRYEARKRELTLASLPEIRYKTAFEPGCSIGVLSRGLAARCDHLLAMDISASALQTAMVELPSNVDLRQGSVPADWPMGLFDLVVLSEIGYYLDADDCATLAAHAAGSARDLVAVHWRHPVADYPLSGDQVHALLQDATKGAGMCHLVDHREDDFRLDVWSQESRSVAQRTGVPSE